MTDQPSAGAVAAGLPWRPVAEWAVWVALAAAVYAQTGRFDQEIAEYAFGAAGWPRALCLAVMAGASGQLAVQLLTRQQTQREAGPVLSWPRQAQRIGIFAWPFVYLAAMPSVGFYVATPVFVLGLLLLLEVRSPKALIAVTAIVCGLVLLIFTRFFYVALPVGTLDGFYEANNAVIVFARTGL